jgi:hypothetical protein
MIYSLDENHTFIIDLQIYWIPLFSKELCYLLYPPKLKSRICRSDINSKVSAIF